MQSQPCRIYLHPTLIGQQAKIDAIVAQTGLAVVVGSNRAAPSLVEPKKPNRITMTIRMPPGFAQLVEALEEASRLRDQVFGDTCYKRIETDPGNGGWIDPTDPFDGGGRAA